jgi:hypothetical protein
VYGPLVAGWLFVLVDVVTDHYLCKLNFAAVALSSVVGHRPRIASNFCSWPTRVSLHVLSPKMHGAPKMHGDFNLRFLQPITVTANFNHTFLQPIKVIGGFNSVSSFTSAFCRRFCAVIEVIQCCSVVLMPVMYNQNGSTFTTNCGGV